MKLRIWLFTATACFFSLTDSAYARGASYRIPKSRSYGSAYGRTHNVRPYFRKDGTFVQGHRAANPRSGVHCHDNVC